MAPEIHTSGALMLTLACTNTYNSFCSKTLLKIVVEFLAKVYYTIAMLYIAVYVKIAMAIQITLTLCLLV